MAAGSGHSLVMKSDGTLTAWGYNTEGQIDVPEGFSYAFAVSAGSHNLVLAEPRVPLVVTQPESVSVVSGQRVELSAPVFSLLPGGAEWFKQGVVDAVATGTVWSKSPARLADAGIYYMVASNALGVVTSQVATVAVSPALVAVVPCRFSGIPLAGEPLTLTANALGEEPLTYLWYIDGQQAHSSTAPEWALSALTPEFTGICQLVVSNDYGTAIGRPFRLAPVQPGLIASWGESLDGQRTVPAGVTNVVAVAAGDKHSLALGAGGAVVAWGDNAYGQSEVPVGLSNVVAVAAGDYFNLVLKSDGTVEAWGDNEFGQGEIPLGLSNVVAAAGGSWHSLALKKDDTLIAWGANGDGQCDVPAGLADVVAIDAGGWHSLALKVDGTAAAWGYNEFGQCDVPAGLSDVVAIRAGLFHSIALKADGTIIVWGDNYFGQLDVPPGLTDVVAIDAWGTHSLALRADGTVVAWGDNGAGQCDVPPSLSNVSTIAAGGHHSLAVVPSALATHTISTPVPVPHSWLDAYPAILASAGGDYEAAAIQTTGKFGPDGSQLSVWHDYVAGTDPTDLTSELRCSIGMLKDSPVLSWTPDMGASRVYTIWGKPELSSGWTTPTNSATRFFRVSVSLP